MGFCRLRRDRTLCKRFVYHQFYRIRETAGCLGATERTGELTAGENWDSRDKTSLRSQLAIVNQLTLAGPAHSVRPGGGALRRAELR